jgi:hypothetical protein
MDRVRAAVTRAAYDMTAHAVEEMTEDGLDLVDVEAALNNGDIAKMERDDPRGIRYIVVGNNSDGDRLVGVVGRFTETGRFLVITAYAMTE